MTKLEIKDIIREVIEEVIQEMRELKEMLKSEKGNDKPKTPTPAPTPISVKPEPPAIKTIAKQAKPVNKVTTMDAITLARKIAAAEKNKDPEIQTLKLAHRAANALLKGQKL